jgi:hypothetical protein
MALCPICVRPTTLSIILIQHSHWYGCWRGPTMRMTPLHSYGRLMAICLTQADDSHTKQWHSLHTRLRERNTSHRDNTSLCLQFEPVTGLSTVSRIVTECQGLRKQSHTFSRKLRNKDLRFSNKLNAKSNQVQGVRNETL